MSDPGDIPGMDFKHNNGTGAGWRLALRAAIGNTCSAEAFTKIRIPQRLSIQDPDALPPDGANFFFFFFIFFFF